MIDESVQRSLFPDEDPIGKTIEIYGEPFTVIGVCTQVGQSELVINSEEEYWTYYQGGSSSGNIYIPKGVWGTIYKFDEAQNLVLQASGADEMAAAGKAAANIMNQNMNVSDSSITYRSEDLMQQAKQLQDMFSFSNAFFSSCFNRSASGLLSSTIAVRRFIAAPPVPSASLFFYIIAQVPPSVVCHSRTKQPVSRRLRQWAEIFLCFPAAMQNKKGTTQCVMPF